MQILLLMQNQNSSPALSLPPPPPPLLLKPPVLADSSYDFYLKRKHLMILNGEPEYGSSKEQVEHKMKKVYDSLEQNAKEIPSDGEPRTIDITLLSYCARCDRWLYSSEMPIHQSCHACIILDNLLLGDKFCSQSRKQLIQRMGVTHIVNAATQLPNFLESEGIQYLKLDLEDTAWQELMGEMERAYTFIKQAHQDGGRVFVHCAVGKSRSVSAILVYLIREKGYSLDQALKYVKERRPIAQPNMGYMRQLRSYEQKLKEGKEGKISPSQIIDQVEPKGQGESVF